MSKLVLALPKGRLLKEVSDLLLSANLIDKPIEEGRKLVLETERFKILLAKPKDVPMLVESGFADVGVSGWDTIWESQREVLEILDLKVGFCRICIAGFPESVSKYPNLSSIKVATKYPNIARTYFEQKGVKPFVYIMNGSVELAPVIGLTDYILDLVQTGRTLRENGLVVVEEISTSTARLIAGKESFYLKNEEILSLAEKLHRVVETSF
ncbi:MAG: ATP phosphoribosyltransferase [Gammaproteobacteria bacterium]|nr:MAG: ATP phosphoribosyltransferase [Gammaproteobacteria bacterium]